MNKNTTEDIQDTSSTQDSITEEGDIFTILVATDIHLGFEEKDPIRDNDTFDTFEEILQIAAAEKVDFILLGGDLFHHAKPSPYCIYKCTELLRRYCLGDRPVEIEFLSDPSHNFYNSYNLTVNYEDPNLNVSIPVFSIHGNHDDPTGHKQISAMDLMATSGLINYFGKSKSYDEVQIEPILLKKGQSKLALYGLSHIKDERLGRLFLDKKVKMMSPEDPENWFHLLVWHQNRATRGVKNFIPDDSLPAFLDLVIWGHEHDCRIVPERRLNDVFVSQPGSSVATSLADGEAKPKKVGILKIYQKKFKMIPIDLKTVRPFIWKELVLKNVDEMINEANSTLTPAELTMDIVTNEIDSMIEQAKNLGRTGRASDKPLIRLNVRYRDERQVFNTIRFGQSYVGKVANPEHMVKCQIIRDIIKRGRGPTDDLVNNDAVLAADRVEDIVTTHFSENDTLKCFPVYAINEAVKKFIDANDTEAPILISDHLIKETLQKLEEDMPEIEDVDNYILNFKKIREQKNLNEICQVLNDPNRQKKHTVKNEEDATKKSSTSNDDDDVMIIDDDDDNTPVKAQTSIWSNTTATRPARGRGSRGTRGSRGNKGKGKGT